MGEVTDRLADFPGFGVRYDTGKNPYFKAIMVENLRKLQQVDVGKTLLSSIGGAAPRARGEFPQNVNVLCVPTEISFVQKGHKLDVVYGAGGSRTVTGMSKSDRPAYSPEGCPFWIDGGSSNAAVDQMAATDGTGSVCFMRFHNAQVMTRKGESTHPYIVLAHELIHSLHCLQGIKKDGKDEELWTTGLGQFTDESMSENAFRSAFGVAPRNQYF